jgi:hypothetical protein
LVALVAAAALLGYLVVADEAFAEQGGESGQASAVRLLEAQVVVTASVACRRYEGRILNCSVDPSAAVADAQPMRLLLGYTSIEIDGNVFDVNPIPGAELKFVPQVGEKRVDVSGSRRVRVGVIYVE